MSVFSEILERALARTSEARAVFADGDGEAIADFGEVDEARLMGAQWGVVLAQAREAATRAGVGPVLEISVQAERGKVVLTVVRDHYYVAIASNGAELYRLREGAEHAAKKIAEEL